MGIRLFCHHDYKLESKERVKSAFAQVQETGASFEKLPAGLPLLFFQGKTIWWMKCTKCGKLKKFTELD